MSKNLLIILFSVTLCNFLFLFIDENGFKKLYALHQEIKKIETETLSLHSENILLESDIFKFSSDLKYIERFLREKYGYIGQNEIIIEFED